jgi:hypothetical protein
VPHISPPIGSRTTRQCGIYLRGWPDTGRHAALVVGASFSHHAQGGRIWPHGVGMPDPQPQAGPPTNPAPEPSPLGNLIHGRLRWLHRLPLAAWWHATVSTVPRLQGQGRPPGQTSEASTMSQTALLVGAGPTPSPEDGQP